jgi:hypothetical protein
MVDDLDARGGGQHVKRDRLAGGGGVDGDVDAVVVEIQAADGGGVPEFPEGFAPGGVGPLVVESAVVVVEIAFEAG